MKIGIFEIGTGIELEVSSWKNGIGITSISKSVSEPNLVLKKKKGISIKIGIGIAFGIGIGIKSYISIGIGKSRSWALRVWREQGSC